MTLLVTIPVIGILIGLSAFFAASEMAFVSTDRIKLRDRVVKGDKNADLLEKLLDDSDEVVSAVVICNNLVNISASIIAGTVAVYLLGNLGAGIAAAVMTLLIVVFGEAMPKAFGINNQKFAIQISRPLYIIRRAFYPAVKSFTMVSDAFLKVMGKEERGKLVITEEEIKTMLDLGVEVGTIKSDERKLVRDVFDFDETRVKEIVVSRGRIVGLQENSNIGKLMKKSVETGYSRFPVFGKNKDDIVGIVHVKDSLLKKEKTPVKEIMRDVLKISPGMKIDNVLREMQRKRNHIAIIQSAEGRTLGLVTMENLIEEIFGEIRDEHDA